MDYFQRLVALDHNGWDNWVFQSWASSQDNLKSSSSLHRIVSQLQYSQQLLAIAHESSELIETISKDVWERFSRRGGIEADCLNEWEERLSEKIEPYNRYELLFVGHSHIDINWQWGWDETVSIVCETAKTILSLLDRYPQLVFSQSQALLYDILSRYDQRSLEMVVSYVQQGRWEPLVSGWVEFDKNSPDLRSYCRQLELGMSTASSLLRIDQEELKIAFEPDTFGHTAYLPEILSSYGLRYYYMCRGEQERTIFNWESPSGASILAYRDPKMYMMGVTGDIARQIPMYAHSLGITKVPALYGLSDHGGGLSIKDIERILDMQTWPAFPKVSFSKLCPFFEHVEQTKRIFSTHYQEMNSVFTACYTSGARIKEANSKAESQLITAERIRLFSYCLSSVTSHPETILTSEPYLDEAWKLLLTNQFHDIITGVGVQATTNHALALSQEIGAKTTSIVSSALDEFVSRIDTSALFPAQGESPSEFYDTATGAGSGFGIAWGINSQRSRGCGLQRVYHLVNLSARPYKGLVPLYVWNYEGDIEQITFYDSEGNRIPHQRSEAPIEVFKGLFSHPQASYYWGQWYAPLCISVMIPPFGYETISLVPDYSQVRQNESFLRVDGITRKYTPKKYRLENSHCIFSFDTSTLSPVSIIDKSSGEELLDTHKPSGFFHLTDDNSEGMDAWEYGRFISSKHLGEVTEVAYEQGELFGRISFRLLIGTSIFFVRYELPNDGKTLSCRVSAQWDRVITADVSESIWFLLALKQDHQIYRADTPGGTVDRLARSYPMPATSWIYPSDSRGEAALFIVGKGLHGYIGESKRMGVTLLRNSRDPNPYNEVGTHEFSWSIGVVRADLSAIDASRLAFDILHDPLVVSGRIGTGDLPTRSSFFNISSSSVQLSSITLNEEGNTMDLYLNEMSGEDAWFTLSLNCPLKIGSAWVLDRDSQSDIDIIDQKSVRTKVPAHGMQRLRCALLSMRREENKEKLK